MFTVMTEEHTESRPKGKPRLPQSQGDLKSQKSDITLRLKTMNYEISRASLKDYKRIARTLQLAFMEDPYTNYILNTDAKDKGKKKKDLMIAFFEYSVFECFNHGGIVYVIKDMSLEEVLDAKVQRRIPFLGCILWNQLELDEDEFGYQSPSKRFGGFHPSSLKFNYFASLARCRLRIFEKSTILDENRSQIFEQLRLNTQNNTIWYLSDVGILPTMQGKGLAKALINYCLADLVDTFANSWCYLESSNPLNRGFYQKLGFELMNTFSVSKQDKLYYSSSSDEEGSDKTGVDFGVCLDGMIKFPCKSN